MSERTVVLSLAGEHKLARDLVAGGVFVPGYDIPLNEDCELVLRGTSAEVRISARVVWSGNGGIGLQLHNCDADMRRRITELATAAEPSEPAVAAREDAPASDGDAGEAADADGDGDAGDGDGDAGDGEGDAGDGDKKAANMHERLRGLTLAQQLKIAHSGELGERVVLERLYSKNVWEALLRNPRLTGPEVARIARMGSLPRPHLEIILGNGGWLQIPEVRRALLTNPRLGTDQVMRILRLVPKHELKMASMQTIYPMAVRDVAKRLLKELGG